MSSRGLFNLGWGALSLAGAAYLSCAAMGGRFSHSAAFEGNPPGEASLAADPGPGAPAAAASGASGASGADAAVPRVRTAPVEAYPGDAILLETASEAREVLWILLSSRGYRVSSARGFGGSETGLTAGLLALPVHTEPGSYRLERIERFPDGSARETTETLTVLGRDFGLEEVRLSAANTAIRRDASPQRKRQIDRLNEILFRFDPDAPRFFGPWIHPVKDARRSSEFADRREYRYADGRKETVVHWGIDYAVPRGTPVYASGDGLVALAEDRISTGLTVVIEHLPGVYSLYYHLDSLAASEGESVRAGTLIGASGSTGLSTGPHLHLEFRVNGEAVSPDWFFTLK